MGVVLSDLLSVARYKGVEELTCERCGQEFGIDRASKKLEVYTGVISREPQVRCRAYQACEARAAQRGAP